METFRLLKLQLAMALLGRSSLAIKEIADRCGFENPLYFTRCFTKLYSQSPTQAPVLRGVDLSIRDPQSISPALFCMLKPHEYFSCRTKKIIYIINIGN